MSGYYQKIGSTYYDVNTIYLSYTSGTKADATNFFNTNGVDLNSIFEKCSNQTQNLSVGYSFKDTFQSKYFTPTATCSVTSDTGSATISITSAAFNKLEITGSGTATIEGKSGTSTYSKSFTGLTPDSNYSYTCTPSNTGTSPAATTTAVSGTATTVTTNTLPIIKSVTAVPASATSITVSWGATGASDCSYSYVSIGRATTSGGTIASLTTNTSLNTFADNTISVGKTYYYTVTPYNKSNIAGTAVTVSVDSFLNTTIDTFTFSSISGLSATTGWIAFNVKISNFTYALLTTNAKNPVNKSTFIYPDPKNPNNINAQYAIQFDSDVSLTFTLLVYNNSTGDKYNGSTTPLAQEIIYKIKSATDTDVVSATNPGYYYWLSVIVVGAGGGGGGGGKGSAGGGGGSGGYIIHNCKLETQDSSTTSYFIDYRQGGFIQGGGAGGGDGTGGSFGSFGNSYVRFTLKNCTSYMFTAECGIGGAGGSSNSANQIHYDPNNKINDYTYGGLGNVSGYKYTGCTITEYTVTAYGTQTNLAVINYGTNASTQNNIGGKLSRADNTGNGGNGGTGGGSGGNGNPGTWSTTCYYLQP